jgi:hypothetical protein
MNDFEDDWGRDPLKRYDNLYKYGIDIDTKEEEEESIDDDDGFDEFDDMFDEDDYEEEEEEEEEEELLTEAQKVRLVERINEAREARENREIEVARRTGPGIIQGDFSAADVAKAIKILNQLAEKMDTDFNTLVNTLEELVGN